MCYHFKIMEKRLKEIYMPEASSVHSSGVVIALGTDSGTLWVTQELSSGDLFGLPFDEQREHDDDSVERVYNYDNCDPLDYVRGHTLLEIIESSIDLRWERS